ncbi:MAG: isopentenyl phosphate kinase [Anaerolineae bacterium]|nr:isopentenyl phosphate kinase [Anaerolineae bacterium]
MITMVKIGGSLITDKQHSRSFRQEVAERLAQEVRAALDELPFPLILGHGSGSFGHFEAREHGTAQGVSTPEQWRGFARVAMAAAELNHLMAQIMQAVGLPVMRFQPSASAQARGGAIQSMTLKPLEQALDHGLVPLVYGDVGFDEVQGGAILSTEQVFTFLARHLNVSRIVILGEVDGVYDLDRRVIPTITPENYEAIRPALGGSAGVDVTGGMLTKVSDMLALAQQKRGLRIYIINGLVPGRLQEALTQSGGWTSGTLIHA